MHALGTLTQPVFQSGPVAGAGGSASARTSTGGSSGSGNRGSATARAASHGRAQLASLGTAGHSSGSGAAAHHVSYLRNSAARSRVPAGGAPQGYSNRSNSLSRVPLRNRHVTPVHSYTRKTHR